MVTTPTDAATDRRRAARAREVLVVAALLGAALWGIGLAAKWGALTDFVEFYTLAHVARGGAFDALRSDAAFAQEQLRVVPESGGILFPSVYPAQIALLVRPLASLDYWTAFGLLSAITVIGFVSIVRRMASTLPSLRPWPRQVTAVALASPALWTLVLHGQISLLGLAALFFFWAAHRSGRPFLAGAAIGLLAYKAPLLAPALVLGVLVREWQLVAGAVAMAAAQFALPVPVVGLPVVLQYLTHLSELARSPDQLAGVPVLMHSLRTFWSGLLRPPFAPAAYAASSAVVMWGAVRLWRRLPHALYRTAVVGATIVLVSPHLYAYDLVLLVPLSLASAEVAMTSGASGRLVALTVVGLAIPLWSIPTAQLGLQASTVVLGLWLFEFSRVASSPRPAPADAPR